MKVLVYGDHKTHMACEAAAGTGHVRHANTLDHAAVELATTDYDYVVVGGDNRDAAELDARALEPFAGKRPVLQVCTNTKRQGAWIHTDHRNNGAPAFAAELDRIIRKEVNRQKAIAAVMSLRQLVAAVIH